MAKLKRKKLSRPRSASAKPHTALARENKKLKEAVRTLFWELLTVPG